LQSARGYQQRIFDCNHVIGCDDIYDNALNVLEKCARYASCMLRKHGITILTIVQHNCDITNTGQHGFIYMNHM